MPNTLALGSKAFAKARKVDFHMVSSSQCTTIHPPSRHTIVRTNEARVPTRCTYRSAYISGRCSPILKRGFTYMNVNLENHPARSSGLGPGGKSCEEDDAMASSAAVDQNSVNWAQAAFTVAVCTLSRNNNEETADGSVWSWCVTATGPVTRVSTEPWLAVWCSGVAKKCQAVARLHDG